MEKIYYVRPEDPQRVMLLRTTYWTTIRNVLRRGDSCIMVKFSGGCPVYGTADGRRGNDKITDYIYYIYIILLVTKLNLEYLIQL